MFLYILYCLMCLQYVIYCQQSTDPNELLNWCLDARHHKEKPGPEAKLFSQCTPWKDKSCCTLNTTLRIHHENMYKFDFSHCSHIKNMSEKCREHFRQDSCFYECSPNIGPWVAKVTMKIRKERFFKVPLCKKDCDDWWEACKNDYTCVDNWVSGFTWTKNGNTCHDKNQCKTFQEIYHTSENFCQTVWDESWEVKQDSEPCMKLWFDPAFGNPNEHVAKLKVAELMRNAASHVVTTIWFNAFSSIVIYSHRCLILNYFY